MQNKILRIITFSPRKTRMTNLYRKYEIVHLEKLYKIVVAKFVYRSRKNLLPEQFISLYNNVNNVHQYRTRLSTGNNLFLPRMKSSLLMKRCIKIVGVKVWNEISCCLTKLRTVKSFSKKLTAYLIDKG